jgi:transcriptional regulator with XRE-family HTH domain
MPRRYTEPYWIYQGPGGDLLLKYEEDWEVVEVVIPNLQVALQIARQRSPDWIISLMDDTGFEIRRFTPHSYLESVPLSENPFYLSVKPEGQDVQRLGPMSEVDFWIGDLAGEGLRPLFTSADPDFVELGELIRDRRLDMGLTQKQLATVASVSPQYLSDMERGQATNVPLYTHVARKLDAYFEGPMPTRPSQATLEEVIGDIPAVPTSARTPEEIAAALLERRLELGLTQQQVAQAAGLNKETISKMERGERRSENVTLRAVARALRVDMPHTIKRNPEAAEPTEDDVEHYRLFHGVEPQSYIDMEVWVPGGMVLIGVGKDVGYGIANKHSMKDGWYVHDFGSQVKIYRRARDGERATKTWSSFPRQLTNLGYNLGFTYLEGGKDGPMKEVKGSRSKYLAVTPNRRTLVILGPKGVEYLMEGGSMRVDDWIRD